MKIKLKMCFLPHEKGTESFVVDVILRAHAPSQTT
jgi:hypothetical protein